MAKDIRLQLLERNRLVRPHPLPRRVRLRYRIVGQSWQDEGVMEYEPARLRQAELESQGFEVEMPIEED